MTLQALRKTKMISGVYGGEWQKEYKDYRYEGKMAPEI